MTELIITRGYPASGKTTWAYSYAEKNYGVKAPSRDDLRLSLFKLDGNSDRAGEDLITQVQKSAVLELLKGTRPVIVDDTNLNYRDAQKWAELAERQGIDFRCVDFNVYPEECKQRNEARRNAGGRYVPPEVIDRMARRSPIRSWKPVEPRFRLDIEPVTPDTTLPPAYIFDIDGTVAHMTGRSPYDYTRVGEDAPDYEVRELYWMIRSVGPTVRSFFVSGRSDDCRDVTESWLNATSFPHDGLFMRKTGDNRDDAAVKLEIFNEHFRGKYNVLGVFDDRDRVVSMWRRLGLKCFQVQPGDF